MRDHARSDDIKTARGNNPHLDMYLDRWQRDQGGMPEFMPNLSRDVENHDALSVIYPVGDPIFIHVHGRPGREVRYDAIEPSLDQEERTLYGEIRERILALAPYEEPPETPEELRTTLDNLYDRVTHVTSTRAGDPNGNPTLLSRINELVSARKVTVTPTQDMDIRYFLHRDIVDHGPLEPIIRDPHIEDIHAIGLERIRHIHKIFDMMETNIRFQNEKELDDFLRNMGERIGRPVSESRPIVDAALPDGSRINIIYSDDVSLKGSSFTIRKFQDTPLSITQIVNWGTLSAQLAAYLWICLEHGQSVFVCGETASGKTTTLNAILSFVQPDEKVYSAEDTPEVQPPQPTWQQLVTREQGPEESRVDMFDLLKAALRSRPNYIIVGEIRGAEGNVAFQAMQTGHPVMATFHASSTQKMIQRLTSEPISVPERFMDNLNVALIQMAVYHQGKMLRRVLGVHEIEGYSEAQEGVMTRGVFQWDPGKDEHLFRGRNNSYVLEERIAQVAGYTDKREIYNELDMRTRIFERMIEEGIFDYYEVKDVIWNFYKDGVQGLPFTL